MTLAKFDKKTRLLIGARAGWRCSFPNCFRLTVGPGALPDEYAQSGTAAHIYSKAENGPRGTGGLSPAERKSAANGIWLCAHHGIVVDNNRGVKYPAALLHSYKLEHEAQIAAEHEGLPSYRFQTLTIHENPVFRPGSTIRFGKVTLLVGNNATGKSTILRWLQRIAPSGRLWEDDRHRKTDRIHYSVTLRCPSERTVGVIRESDRLSFMLDGRSVLTNPIMTEIVFRHRDAYSGMLEGYLAHKRRDSDDRDGASLDDVALLAQYMNINSLLVPNLMPYVSSFVENSMENPRIEEIDGLRKIFVDDKNRTPEHRRTSIHRISGSMTSRLVLDMQIAMANLMAGSVPTILFLSIPNLHLDADNLELYVNLLLSPEIRFQTVLESVDPRVLSNSLGWSIVRLSGQKPNCAVEQVC